MPVLVRMIMRWSTFYVLVAMMHHKQMAILDTCYEFSYRTAQKAVVAIDYADLAH